MRRFAITRTLSALTVLLALAAGPHHSSTKKWGKRFGERVQLNLLCQQRVMVEPATASLLTVDAGGERQPLTWIPSLPIRT